MLDELLQQRHISRLELGRKIADLGLTINRNTINKICNNTIVRIPLDYIQSICYVLQVSPAAWIADSNVHSSHTTSYRSHNIKNNMQIKLKEILQQQGKKLADLLKYFDDKQMNYRQKTLNDLYNSKLKHLPVYLIIPISEFLKVSIDEWLYMDALSAPSLVFSLDTLMTSNHIDAADLVGALEGIGVFAKLEDIHQLQNNTLSYIPKDLIAGICNVFGVHLQEWITVEHN